MFILMTFKDSHVSVMFEKIMYKVKDNTFRVRDFTKSDEVDESKFVEGVNQKGNKQLQSHVYVLFEDEYQALLHDIEDALATIDLKEDIIKDKDKTIKKLESQIEDNKHANLDEIKQLKEDKFNMSEDHQKEVSKLHQEKTNLEKTYLEELDQLKKTHANQMLDVYRKHNKETNKLKEQYDTKIDEINDKLLSEVQANKQANDKLKDEISSLHQAKSTLEKDYLEDLKTLESEHANEILDITKAHHDEVMHLKEETSQIKEDHQKEMREIDKDHSDEIEHIRTTFLKLVTNENTQDINEINAIAGDVPSILKPFLRKHLTKLEDMKERKQSHEPERIINTYELSGEKEKE